MIYKLFLAVLLLPAFLFQSCNSIRNVRTMILSASGEVSAEPDIAKITIELSCVDKDITTSKECLISKSDELNNLILSYDIKKEDILTTAIDLSQKFDWSRESNKFIGYESSITTRLTVKNMDILEKLIPQLLVNENIRLRNLTYDHTKIDSLKNLAYKRALNNANILADELLSKMKESNKEIIRIGNVDFSTTGRIYHNSNNSGLMASISDVANISVNNGTVNIQSSLMVEYMIK